MLFDKINETIAKEKLGEEINYTPTYSSGIDVMDYRNGRIEKGKPAIGFDGGRIITVIGKSGSGKAQPLYSNIVTPTGFKKMGELNINDDVITPEGTIAKIIGIYPQGIKDNYKVIFTDGSSMECNDEHLFEVSYNCWSRQNKITYKKSKVMTLKEIQKDYISSNNKLKYYIPMTKPVEFKEKDVPINPYLLGVLIGDGNMTEKSNHISICNSELDIIEKCKYILNQSNMDIEINDYNLKNCSFCIKNKNGLKNQLIDLKLYGKYSYEKEIPDIYKFNSVSIRLELLKGLIDTDGSIEKDNCIYYYTSSEKLANDVKFIVESLGGIVNIMVKNSSYYNKSTNEKIICKDNYRIFIKLPNNIIPFTSIKHSKKYVKCEKYKEPIRKIAKIEKIGKTQMQCIMLNSDRHLYLTDDFIVTHNTSLAIKLACSIVEPYKNGNVFHYDFERGTNASRIKTISGWSDEDIENKYKVLQRNIYSESIYKLVRYIDKLKNTPETYDEIKVDSGVTDSNGNPVYVLPPTVILIDSWALCLPENISEEEELSGQMSAAAIARTNNSIIKRLATPLERGNIILIVINHITTKIEVNAFSKSQPDINYLKQNESIPGGSSIIFLANNIIRCTTSTKLEEDSTYGIKGFMVKGEFVKSRANEAGRPFLMVFNQANGFDNVLSNLVNFKELGLLKGSPRAYYLEGCPNIKFTLKTFKQKYLENKELQEEVKKLVKENYIKFIPNSEFYLDKEFTETAKEIKNEELEDDFEEISLVKLVDKKNDIWEGSDGKYYTSDGEEVEYEE